ncbi:MAG: CHASE2 domain-containing protein [Cytophagales bacterium]|nr:CHASE2 domain-containing protein [Cytophagales bacterium]
MPTRKRFWLDTLFATVFVFFLMGILFNISLLGIFDVFDPIGDALGDMEMSDIVFSRLREDPPADTNLVVVNFASMPRDVIGDEIRIISKYQPKCIGIDSFFSFPKDSVADSVFEASLAQVDSLIMVSKLLYNEEKEEFDTIKTSWDYFNRHAVNAYANLATDAGDQDDFKVCRSFIPKMMVNGEEQIAFAIKLAQIYDPVATAEFLARTEHGKEITINYRGNVMDGRVDSYRPAFFALDWDQVLAEDFDPWSYQRQDRDLRLPRREF